MAEGDCVGSGARAPRLLTYSGSTAEACREAGARFGFRLELPLKSSRFHVRTGLAVWSSHRKGLFNNIMLFFFKVQLDNKTLQRKSTAHRTVLKYF